MNLIKNIIRVDHAGEQGAKDIYRGQIAARDLEKNSDTVVILQHMLEQESEHYEYFEQERIKRKISPTLLMPIWRRGGYLLGYITSFFGTNTAMLCTDRIEKVIDEHYQEQLEYLKYSNELDLKEKIIKFQAEELEHRNIALQYPKSRLSYILGETIEKITKFAIYVTKKI